MDVEKSWVRQFVNVEEERRVSQAVHIAESHTAGEIVPVIVRCSSAIGHVPHLLVAFSFAFFLTIEVAVFYFSWPLVFHYINLAGFGLQLFVIPYLCRQSFVQRMLTSGEDQHRQVLQRAELEFCRRGVGRTAGRTGVLIMISLMEREAVVLADKAISDRLSQETWQALINNLVGKIREAQAAEGLIAAVEQCGRVLQQHFPADANNNNELSNHLHILE